MRYLFLILPLGTLLTVLFTGFALAETDSVLNAGCERASRPQIPDGAAINKMQLLDAKTRLDTYLSKAENFLACLKHYEVALGENIDGDKKVAIIATHNAVVDEMYLAGDEFNVALRKFNLRGNP